jgi:beta-glucosidase
VGTNDEWETEGEDRSTIQLPGDQDELVARVAAANPRTVVVVNAGSPVSMPWVDDVAAVLVAYFGGQEMGPAVADVLVGASDPGGRLPITYPRRLEDTPAWPHYAPVEGAQVYGEGLLMGYRGFDAGGTAPLFPFGHGLSYGACSWGEATLDLATEGGVTVSLDLTADGDRATTAVVQAYVAPVDPPVERAPKELAAWTKVVVAPGSTERVAIQLPATAFRRWDDDANGWTVDEGRYEILVAASAGDVRQRLPFDVGHNL